VHGWLSANVVMTGTKLRPSLADAWMDHWEHELGPGDEMMEGAFLHWGIENTPVECHHRGTTTSIVDYATRFPLPIKKRHGTFGRGA
jgi:hypothetical protein